MTQQYMKDKQREVNLLIEREIVGNDIARAFWRPGWQQYIEEGYHQEHIQIRIEGVLKVYNIRFYNEPIIYIDDDNVSCKECYSVIAKSIDSGKYCVIKDFVFTLQGVSVQNDNQYNGTSKMKICTDDGQTIIIETSQTNNSFTKIM